MNKPLAFVASLALLFLLSPITSQAAISEADCARVAGLVSVELPADGDAAALAAFHNEMQMLQMSEMMKGVSLVPPIRYFGEEGTEIPKDKEQAYRFASRLTDISFSWITASTDVSVLLIKGPKSASNKEGYEPAEARCKMGIMILWRIAGDEANAWLNDEERRLDGREPGSHPGVGCGANMNILPLPDPPTDKVAFHTTLEGWIYNLARRHIDMAESFVNVAQEALFPAGSARTLEEMTRQHLVRAAYDFLPRSRRIATEVEEAWRRGPYTAANQNGYSIPEIQCLAERIEMYTILYGSTVELLEHPELMGLQLINPGDRSEDWGP